jgi:exodeoxyribonuclease V gamma subunit
MIELFYSNRTEQLLDALADTVKGQRFNSHPLEVVELVVPNRNMETWVRLGLAQKLGVAANLRFRRLEQFIGDVVAKTCPGDYKLVDLDIIEAAILAILLDEDTIGSPELEPVRRYLDSSGETAQILPGSEGPSAAIDNMLLSDGADIRKVQLAVRMAYLFQEYSYSRSEMVADWRGKGKLNMEHRYADPVKLDQDLASTVAWQRALWQEVFAEGGLLEKNPPPEGGRWITLDQLAAEAELVSMIRMAELPPVHIFGVSYVARLFQNLFTLLAENNPLFIYTLNPCAEFWEDVETERAYYSRLDKEKNRREKRIWAEGGETENDDPFGLFAADNPALRYWGHPGREHVRLLGELTDCDFTDRFTEPEGGSLLQVLQRDILFREPEKTEDKGRADSHKPDNTIKLIAAPSVRREVEWVADEIWKLMKNDRGKPPLRFSDIAVIINSAGRDIYLPQVETVFASSHNLPNSVSDLPGTAGSRIFEVMTLLLKLPFGRFSRAEMLALMSHPAVIGRFAGLSPGDLTALAEALGIVFGADRTDFEGTYVDRDVYNWDQGIRRLALGAFMTGEKSGDERIFQVGEDQWLVEEVSGSLRTVAARFGMLARSLLLEARFVRSSKMTLSDWASFYSAQIDTYLHLEDEADKRDRLRLLRALAKLEKMDLGQKISGRIAAEITGKAIESLGSARGQYLAEGVVVSSFLPMRVIPFKVIFLLGLGEGLFPAAGSRDALDLRAAARRAGDVDPAERDRYMFLETLLCSRERLYLSYVKRDEQTGDPLQPSAVVQELLHILKQNYLTEEDIQAIYHEPQLRRYEGLDNGGETFFDEARIEAKIRHIAQNWREHALPVDDDSLEPGLQVRGSLGEELNTLQKVAGDGAWQKLSSMLVLPGEAPLPAAVKAVPRVSFGDEGSSLEAPFYLSHSTLRRFLECPMQGWAAAMLGLTETEEDLADREEEDFEVDRLIETVLMREVFAESLSSGESPEELYRKRIERLRLAGRIPVGELGRVIERRHLDIFAGWQATLELLANNGDGGVAAILPQPLERVRLGRSKGLSSTEHVLDPLSLDLEIKKRDSDKQRIAVHLGGLSDGLIKGWPVTITFLARKPFSSHGKTAVTGSFRYLLRGLIDQALLAAAGVLGDGERQILLCFSDGPEETAIYRMRLQPANQEKAFKWLSLLAEDLLSAHHAYLLPVEAVITHYYELVGGGRSQSMLSGISMKEFAAGFDGSELVRLIVNMAGNNWSRFSSLWGPVPSPRNYLPPAAEVAFQMVFRRFGPLFEDIISLEVVK